MGNLMRLRASLYNTPHLATHDTFEMVETYFNKRMDMDREDIEDVEINDFAQVVDGVGFLSVAGALTYLPVQQMCGGEGCSYQRLYEGAAQMIDDGVKTIVFDVNSGGGQAYSCFDYAMKVRQMATDNNVKLIAYVDGMACSAAYAWACIADEVIANANATVGSIGVIISLLDASKAISDAGYKRIFITSGNNKAPFAEDGSFKQEFLDKLKAEVDLLCEQFVEHVSMNMGIEKEAIYKMEASTYLASQALDIGLVDKTMNQFEFAEYMNQYKQSNKKQEKKMGIMGMFNKSAKTENVEAKVEGDEMINAEMQEMLNETVADLEQTKVELASLKADMNTVVEQANSFKAQADEWKQKYEAVVQSEVDKKMEARKAELKAVIGDVEFEAQWEQMKELNDNVFAFAIAGHKAALDAKKASFKEIGVEGADASTEDKAPDLTQYFRK